MDGANSCKTILAARPAKAVLDEVSESVSKLRKRPVLVGFLSNTDPAARKYAEWTGRTCEEK